MDRYREDIDGLRAIAVLPVVFYHVGWSIFSGGFVGVDIFFVISGYLITSIILREIQRGEFSMWRFYERRIRRIYPAVLTVCVFVVVAGALLLPAQQFKRVGQALISMDLYASNILFFKQADYFNADSELNPFLHTWSLSVEEQFYLIFPIFLLFVFKLFKNKIHASLVAAIFISFIVSSFSVFRWPMAAFYLIPFRAWELAFGAFLATGIPRTAKTQSAFLSGIGILCMLYSIFFYSSATPFPGVAALLPCLGAALVIYGGNSANVVNRWLGNPVLRHFGLISYSFYLWHWPVFVFGRYFFPNGSPLIIQLLQIAIAWSCAYLSWRYIETPFRKKNIFAQRKGLFTFFGATTAVTFLGGGLMIYGNGFSQRMPPAAIALEHAAADSNPRRPTCHGDDDKNIKPDNYCTYGAEVAPTLAVWGDSHGVEISPALGALVKNLGLSLKAFTYSQCPPALEFTTTGRRGCVSHNNQVLAYLAAHPEIKVVFMIANYHIYEIDGYREAFEKGFSRSVNSLEQAGKKVVTIYPFPGIRYSIPVIAAAWVMQGRAIESLSIPTSYYRTTNARAVSFLDRLPNTDRLHPESALCENLACAITHDGRSLYFDNSHLSMYGASYVIKQLAPQTLALTTNVAPTITTATLLSQRISH
jgi:peptidoglycan/LPS O-acetylase OafA/YrhL